MLPFESRSSIYDLPMKKELSIQALLAMHIPNIILYASPVLILMAGVEWYYSSSRNKNTYHTKDTLAAVVIGFVNLGISALLKITTFGLIVYFYNLIPWSLPSSLWTFLLCLIWLDFWRYVSHLVSHKSRIWWATHVTHHSSEKYNLSVSFRLGWTQYIKIIFFIPVILAGFHPIEILISHQIAVLYQFWIHTEYIKKLPTFFEYIFVTPSHHRVHHGSNDKYLDKNFGSTLIIWDRIFGTFQEEEEKVKYGLTQPVNSYNPIFLCFHEWISIIVDLRKAKSFNNALVIIFGRPVTASNKKKPRAMD